MPSTISTGPVGGAPRAGNPPRDKQRHQWWTPFEDEIIDAVVTPRLRWLLEIGVASKSDLIRQWELHFSYKPSTTQMNKWLAQSGLLELFDAPKHFQLPSPPPTYQTATFPASSIPQPVPAPAPVPAAPPAYGHGQPTLPPNLQRALSNFSESELRDPGLVREALNLAAENPAIRPIVPSHVNRPNPYPAPPRTFLGPNGPVQLPPGVQMPGFNAPGF